jgi:hypothetical protein
MRRGPPEPDYLYKASEVGTQIIDCGHDEIDGEEGGEPVFED